MAERARRKYYRKRGQIAERVKACGTILLDAQHIEKDIIAKEGRANFVTVYDKKVQKILRFLKKQLYKCDRISVKITHISAKSAILLC